MSLYRNLSSSFLFIGTVALSGCAADPRGDDVDVRVSADSVTPSVLNPPANTWTWVDVPGSKCGNGGQVGFGINVGTSDDIVIYLEGGGACWDEITCKTGTGPGMQLASYFISGYTQTDFNAWKNAPPGIFNRNQANNPFKNSTIVFVPYCTGDFHTGSRTQTWSDGSVHYFAGKQNLDLYLNEIVPSFPNVSRITLAGSSAGGFGATIDYWRVRQAFGGNKRVDLVVDSAPMFPENFMLNSGWGSWDLGSALPPACGVDCRNVYSRIYTHYGETYPDSKFSFISYNADQLMAIGTVQTPQAFQDSLGQLVWERIRPLSNWRYLLPEGTGHALMLYYLDRTAGPQVVGDWLGQQKNDVAAWSSRTPTGTHCKDGDGKINGASEVKYLGMGGCSSWLGAPTSVTANTSDYNGRKTFLQNGAIWSHETFGQYEVHGPILSYWASKGYETSSYGYPRTDQQPTAASGGVKSTFGGGAIFSWSAGTFGVTGAIWTKYKALGADASVLGLPMSGEIPTGFLNADRKMEFQYGWIYWNPTSGATYWMK